MKRRDFVKSGVLTTIGVSIVGPLETFADTKITHYESEDLKPFNDDDDYVLNFIAIGDWGRSGEYNQLEVARQMGTWANSNPNSFVLSLGDNFYPKGVISEFDPLWHYSFENIYTAHSLQCDWYSILGNHDHGANPDAQIKYSAISRRWNMPARYYAKEVNLGRTGDKVLFVMLDTNPMVHEEEKNYTNTQLHWLEETLSQASEAVKWKIVVGHHPAYSVGPRIDNFDTLSIRKLLSPILNKHKVDVYLSGHEHSLQHLKPAGFVHQFISGAGSELTPVKNGVDYSRYEISDNGFMYISMSRNRLRLKVVHYEGKVIYEHVISK
jgi:tartrate-resistant acid phosphatase type 5